MDNPEWAYSYSFLCPCGVRRSEVIDFDTFQKLRSVGCEVRQWYYPVIETGEGPPISEDDVVNCMLDLHSYP